MSRRISVALTVAVTAMLSVVVPSTAHATTPDPVIVIAGFASPAEGGLPLALRLQANGAQIFYTAASANSGTGDIVAGAQSLGTFVDSVLAQTGASKVDLVGLSMGGLTARQYVKFNGGDAKVDSLVTLGSPNYGTNRAALAQLLNCLGIVACDQMVPGSAFLNDLNAGDDTIGSVRYTTFRTLWDEVVVPIDNAKLQDGATNVLIQSQCLFRFVEHQLLALDGTVADGVQDALNGGPIQLNCWAL